MDTIKSSKESNRFARAESLTEMALLPPEEEAPFRFKDGFLLRVLLILAETICPPCVSVSIPILTENRLDMKSDKDWILCGDSCLDDAFEELEKRATKSDEIVSVFLSPKSSKEYSTRAE